MCDVDGNFLVLAIQHLLSVISLMESSLISHLNKQRKFREFIHVRLQTLIVKLILERLIAAVINRFVVSPETDHGKGFRAISRRETLR